ncbi:ribonuclease R [Glaesserella parasuis]|uniref:ribonuclease R n=1 Tax=Glaesserella parasuis TaxID=738 RepID=UPI0003ABE5B1|nr:ribonuclease R [Glaesserella parasuis]ATW46546.1 ribonuclease R [Glaesserella parasuis str. Nagasaki]EQA00470.1 ribonuclease R [Glaesserella parasuis str. Nagasaki]EYE71459.1 ribonuclease R [Glaesserella parasuis str. Nagasaki]MDE3954247.1 ribonuclease R [Glaesserella parasuis]MDE4006354.1 ribonuclease R [Glaesserella parasuis]
MIVDPNYQKELEKYENPVPSREFILQTIRDYDAPMSREELLEAFHLYDEERQEAVRRRLRAMENDGQLVFTKKKRYALPEKMDLIKGTVIGHRDGYGFLQVEGDDDWFIPNSQMIRVMHGDFVLAQPNGIDRRGRKEVRIVRVLEARKKQIVGRFFTESGINYVVPDDSRINQDILIPEEHRLGARMGQVVVVELQPRKADFKRPVGVITEILGDNLAPGMEIEIALRNHDIPHIWPEGVEKQVRQFSEEVPEEAKIGRVDLRDLPLVTIDGESARDFDDAVFCQKESNGWRLWVAIADVSYYVRPKTALDLEAQQRGNSVYFPNRVIPMLPEVLSNGLCSLNPQVDRLCLVAEMAVSESGKLLGYKFYEAVMNSHARLTYTKVWNILEGDEALRERYFYLVPHLEELHAMYKVLLNTRHQRGAIEFETVENQFIFNPQGRIERIEPVIRNDAHKIIEECMILANIASARFVEEANEPALFRIHAQPSEEKLTSFRTFLKECGLCLNGGLRPTPKDYAELLEQVKERPDAELIQTMLLRSFKQAVYSPDNEGHFGLALTEYAHFTSPIRRYPDLLLHRAIKYLIEKEKGNKRHYTDGGGYHYQIDDMDIFGEKCSATERRADEATREVADWLKCEYMQDHIGEVFDGVISSVTGFGLFVKLNELLIDGLVHISTLDNGYYHFDSDRQRLVGENGVMYRLGDPVRVKVIGVNLDDKKIDFALVTSLRKARGEGKTAKKKAKAEKPVFKEVKIKNARTKSINRKSSKSKY